VAELASAPRPNCPLVLVADDEPDILELVRMVLEEEGYEVATADNGATALRMANERRPDLCVLDVMMPEIDGYDVARVLKRDEELRTIPVILLTARTEPENVARGREAGADEYIAKPFLPEEFQNAVRSVLSERSAAASASVPVEPAAPIVVEPAAPAPVERAAPIVVEPAAPAPEPAPAPVEPSPAPVEPAAPAPLEPTPAVPAAPTAVPAEAAAAAPPDAVGNGAAPSPPHPEAPLQVEPESVPAPVPQTGSMVLLAGGNQNLINVARYRLELGGYEVTTAEDPARAIELASQMLPDVFVLDASTPNVDPGAVARLLRERQGAKEIAFITLSNGGPFDPQDLFTRIETALGQR
jgi:CheY-like chemotaxis protein